jgi:hypothetical protein
MISLQLYENKRERMVDPKKSAAAGAFILFLGDSSLAYWRWLLSMY